MADELTLGGPARSRSGLGMVGMSDFGFGISDVGCRMSDVEAGLSVAVASRWRVVFAGVGR